MAASVSSVTVLPFLEGVLLSVCIHEIEACPRSAEVLRLGKKPSREAADGGDSPASTGAAYAAQARAETSKAHEIFILLLRSCWCRESARGKVRGGRKEREKERKWREVVSSCEAGTSSYPAAIEDA